MRPRLVPLSGSPAEVPLPANGLTIGRDPSNTIQVEETTVSSRHCSIENDDTGFFLVDQESQNGTLVNGLAAVRVRLNHGDEIQVGRSQFRFLLDESGAGTSTGGDEEESDPDSPLSTETLRLHPQLSAYQYAPLDGDGEYMGRLARDMNAILRLNGEISRISGAAELQEVLLKRTFERIPAETGVILLGRDADELGAAARQSDSVRVTGKPYVCNVILQQVMSSGEAVLRNDLLAAQDTSAALRSARMRSVLCVPLTVMGAKTGVPRLGDNTEKKRD